MFNLDKNERVIKVVHRHWFNVVVESAVLLILLVAPFVGARFIPEGFFSFLPGNVSALFTFLASLWVLVIWVMFFIFWTDYYLDIWIITTHGVVDIEQKGLFSRDVATAQLDKIQDMRVQVSGVFPTLLGFGDIHIQTAGADKELVIRQAPNPNQIRELITQRINTPPVG